MRKGILLLLTIVLAGVLLVGTALADYGYTSVSQIPMAVDFTFSVEFDDEGLPHVVTDYPFDKTGAAEMNLTYNMGESREAVTLNYRYPAGTTRIGCFDGSIYDSHGPLDKAYEDIRNGVVTLDDAVVINTAHFNNTADWFLTYSLSGKKYVSYSEKTYAQAFNGMGAGGVAKSVYYDNGVIDSSRILVRAEESDMIIYFNRYGEITRGSISQYRPESAHYTYSLSTGLFNGHTASELGFKDSDLAIPALAAIGSDVPAAPAKTEAPMNTVAPTATEAPAEKTSESVSSIALAGGLLVGLLIGIFLYYARRRKAADNNK